MSEVATPDTSMHANLDAMLSRAAAKDRVHIQRHLTGTDAEPDPSHGALWRRLADKLASLAPLPIQTAGHSGVLFFVPDGKYRMQLFALEDQNDGRVVVYLPDILQQAINKKIIKPSEGNDEFPIVGAVRNTLHVELLDSQNTPEPPTHVKNMLGWNRKAMRVTLPAVGSDGSRIDAAEALCLLAVKLREAAQPPKPAAPEVPVAKPIPGKAAPEKAEKHAVEKLTAEKPAKAAKPAKPTTAPSRKTAVKRRTA